MRKATIIVAGSRGDIQPYIALADYLKRDHWQVIFVANTEAESLCTQYNIPFHSLNFSVKQMLESTTGKKMLQSASVNISKKHLVELTKRIFAHGCKSIANLKSNIDVIICNDNVFEAADAFAEKHSIALVALTAMPRGITKSFPHPYLDTWWKSLIPNKWTHYLVFMQSEKVLYREINNFRKALGLKPLSVHQLIQRRERCPTLQAFTPAVFPPPKDWNKQQVVCGYWHLEKKNTTDNTIVNFLNKNPEPIYIGFGSMIYNVEKVLSWLPDIAKQFNRGVIFLLGWNHQIKNQASLLHNSNILCIQQADHNWLFPKMGVIVHHGGAGTTAAALRAGIPGVVSWFIVDQKFWAHQVDELAVGKNAGAFKNLEKDRLVQKIEQALNCADQSRILGDKLRKENGLQSALKALDKWLSKV